jgi:hypothetical protein
MQDSSLQWAKCAEFFAINAFGTPGKWNSRDRLADIWKLRSGLMIRQEQNAEYFEQWNQL